MSITVESLQDDEVVDIMNGLNQAMGPSPEMNLIAVLAMKKGGVFFESGARLSKFLSDLRERHRKITAAGQP